LQEPRDRHSRARRSPMDPMTITCDVCGAIRPSYPAVASGYVTCVRCRRTGKGTGAVIAEAVAEQIGNTLEGVTSEPFGEAARALATADYPLVPLGREKDRRN
jgi:hypothetical protein